MRLTQTDSAEKPETKVAPSPTMTRRSLLKYGVAAAVVVAAAGTGAYYYLSTQGGSNVGPNKTQVKVGFSIALSGPNAAAGLDQFQAYKQWADLVNADGGMEVGSSKLPVSLTYYDDTGDPATAISLYERLITEDKVDLVLPPWGTYMHYALIPTVTKHGMPMIANTADTDQVFTLPSPFWYFQPFSHKTEVDAIFGAINANVSKITGGSSRKINIAIPWAQSLGPDEIGHDAFVSAENAGNFNIINNSSYETSTTDFSSLVLDIKAGNPDVIVAGTYPPDSLLFTDQLVKSGVNPAVLYEWVGPFFEFFRAKFGENVVGISCLGQMGADPNKSDVKPLVTDFNTRYQYPPPIGDYGLVWGSVQILQAAVKSAASLDPEKIQAHLLSDTFPTINGPVAFHDRPYCWETQYQQDAANQWLSSDYYSHVPVWGVRGPTSNNFLCPKPAWK